MNWNDEKNINWINVIMFVFLVGLGFALIFYQNNIPFAVMSFLGAGLVAWKYFQVKNK